MICKYLFVPDLHAPWCDWVRVREVLKWAKSAVPKQIILLGDVMDAYLLSRFHKKPDLATKRTVRREQQMVSRLIELFAEVSQLPLIYLRGNHEARMESRLAEVPLLALYMGQWTPTVGCSKVRYIPSGTMVLEGGQVFVCHGWRARDLAGNAALSLVRNKSVVQGHTHKLALAWRTERLFGMECGYLGRKDAPCFEYQPGLRQGIRDWKHGFGWLDDGGLPHVESLA